MTNVDFESDKIKQTKAYHICAALKALTKFASEEDDDFKSEWNAFSIARINKRVFFGHNFD